MNRVSQNICGTLTSLLLLILIWIPIYISRCFSSLLGKICLPKGSRIVDTFSSCFSPGNYATSKFGISVAKFILKGDARPEQIFKTFSHIADNHWKLQCYPRIFMNYPFWVKEKNFDVQSHLKEVIFTEKWEKSDVSSPYKIKDFDINLRINDDKLVIVKDRDVLHLENVVLQQPFQEGLSPWVLYAVRNYDATGTGEKPSFILILKYHQSMGDAASVMRTLLPSVQLPGEKLAMSAWKKTMRRLKGMMTFGTPIYAPTGPQIANPLFLPRDSLKPPFKTVLSDTRLAVQVDFDEMRRYRRRKRVPMLAVQLTGITEGIQKLLQRRRCFPDEKLRLTISVAFPYKDGEKGLSNSWSFGHISLPVGMLDEESIIKDISAQIEKEERESEVFRSVAEVIGTFPHSMQEGMQEFPVPFGLSSVAGPVGPVRFSNGWELQDISFCTNLLCGSTGIIFSSASYNGKWNMELIANDKLIKCQEDADFLSASISSYFKFIEIRS